MLFRSSSGRCSPYHQSGKSWGSFAGRCFVDSFIHENGNDNAVVTALGRVRDSTGSAEPMCVLSRRQSWLGEEGIPARLEASPSLLARCPLKEKFLGEGKTLARLARLGEPLQAQESLILSEIF